MGNLAFTNKTINKYFNILKKLDINSKKRLIHKLRESLEEDGKDTIILKDIFGAWDDNKSADEIVRQIRESRVNYGNREDF